jgi:hypothetical protein
VLPNEVCICRQSRRPSLGACNLFAKNGAILYRGAHGTLAPLYDIVPVTMDDKVTHELAFTLGGARLTEDVTVAALEQAMRRNRDRMRRASQEHHTLIARIIPQLRHKQSCCPAGSHLAALEFPQLLGSLRQPRTAANKLAARRWLPPANDGCGPASTKACHSP